MTNHSSVWTMQWDRWTWTGPGVGYLGVYKQGVFGCSQTPRDPFRKSNKHQTNSLRTPVCKLTKLFANIYQTP